MAQNKIQFIFCVREDVIVLRNMNLQKQLSDQWLWNAVILKIALFNTI